MRIFFKQMTSNASQFIVIFNVVESQQNNLIPVATYNITVFPLPPSCFLSHEFNQAKIQLLLLLRNCKVICPENLLMVENLLPGY